MHHCIADHLGQRTVIPFADQIDLGFQGDPSGFSLGQDGAQILEPLQPNFVLAIGAEFDDSFVMTVAVECRLRLFDPLFEIYQLALQKSLGSLARLALSVPSPGGRRPRRGHWPRAADSLGSGVLKEILTKRVPVCG